MTPERRARSSHRLVLMLCAAGLLGIAGGTAAQGVTGLSAVHGTGQTFLSWKAVRGPVSAYVIYRSSRPISTGFALRSAVRVGEVRPGAARNVRLESILGTPQFYRIPSMSAPLQQDDELCVLTTARTGTWYYAVTAVGPRGEVAQAVPGRNSLTEPLYERVGRPAPFFQQRVLWNGRAVDLFVHWASPVDIPGTPAMTTLLSHAFNLAVVKNGRAAVHPLVVRLHGRGDHFLSQVWTSGNPQEYVLALDDALPGDARTSYWYGWSDALDPAANGVKPPVGGRVVDFTARRVRWTVDWACRVLPVDTARVTLVGVSMGASGALIAALSQPQRYAAVSALLPRVTYLPTGSGALHQPRGSRAYELIWGASTSRLLSDGVPVYERVRFATLARSTAAAVPFLSFVSGRRDETVGWMQMQEAFQTVRSLRLPARMFWDGRGHEVGDGTFWRPEEHLFRLSRLRSTESLPAVSNCDADNQPGSGAADGDSIGQWSAFVEWHGPVIDRPDCWSMALRIRPLQTRDGPREPPPTVTADITPRRLQRFVVRDGAWYRAVLTAADGTVRSELVRAADGRITVRGVPLRRDPVRLDLRPAALAAPR